MRLRPVTGRVVFRGAIAHRKKQKVSFLMWLWHVPQFTATMCIFWNSIWCPYCQLNNSCCGHEVKPRGRGLCTTCPGGWGGSQNAVTCFYHPSTVSVNKHWLSDLHSAPLVDYRTLPPLLIQRGSFPYHQIFFTWSSMCLLTLALWLASTRSQAKECNNPLQATTIQWGKLGLNCGC